MTSLLLYPVPGSLSPSRAGGVSSDGVRTIHLESLMAHVVFLRAGNVGGKNVFRPAQLAAALAHLDGVNGGAAGTFLVRAKAPASSIRREILAQLEFVPEVAVPPAREGFTLVRKRPRAGCSRPPNSDLATPASTSAAPA